MKTAEKFFKKTTQTRFPKFTLPMERADDICFIPADIEILNEDEVSLLGKGFTSHDPFDYHPISDVMHYYENAPN